VRDEGVVLVKFNLMSLGDLVTDPITGARPTGPQRHREFVERAVRAEAAGFNGVNIGEHHGIEYIFSAPPVMLAAIAARTTTLRLGTAVTLLANLDGLRIAEDYATLDALSNGRVEIVSGRGNFFTTTYDLFGQSLEESRDRFAENAELLVELWQGKPVHWSGRFRPPINGETLRPAPVQDAHDVMWLGGGSSEDSIRLAARLGWKLMLPTAFGRPMHFAPFVDLFLREWDLAGHTHEPEIGALWHVWVAPTREQARAQWEPRYRAYLEWMQGLLHQVNPTVPSYNDRPFDFDWLTTEGPAICGSPDDVVERLMALATPLHANVHQVYMDMGGMPSDELFDAIELMGSAVMPELADVVL
jgi:alkanesulfonate monooxygenase SsuD/methylene tetrahydromethanopterin reductase-like flavin-dependent oxidoreductase (luciferase family)